MKKLTIKQVHEPYSGYKWELYELCPYTVYYEGIESSFDECIAAVYEIRKMIHEKQ